DATGSHWNIRSTFPLPRRPNISAFHGSLIMLLIPHARESGVGSTLIPFTKESMFSESPPTFDATTGFSALHASSRTRPNGSFLLGMTTTLHAFRRRTYSESGI